MPSPRAGGKALQSGDNLIYTLGYTDSTLFTGNNQSLTLPENYIYDGKEWKKSGKSLRSFSQTKIERGNKAYASVNSNIGISRDGLTYINTPVYDYGDTYTYNASTDTFKDTGYSYLGEDEVVATVVDNDIYAYDDIACITYKAEDAIDSGLIKISGVSNKHGKIKGTGKILPGSITTIKSRSNSGYYTTNLSASGIKATKNCARGMYLNIQSTKDIKVKAEYAKFKVKNKSHDRSIKVGEKYRIKTMISPKKAAKQWKLSYKSSNKKYATVSSKGVVTAKNAGKGKTVTITVKLKDSGKTVNKFKVTIR